MLKEGQIVRFKSDSSLYCYVCDSDINIKEGTAFLIKMNDGHEVVLESLIKHHVFNEYEEEEDWDCLHLFEGCDPDTVQEDTVCV